ncbi:MAG: hypothetical protein U1F43_38825 [Myxococcota bacterium]
MLALVSLVDRAPAALAAGPEPGPAASPAALPPVDYTKELLADVVVVKGKKLTAVEYGILDYGGAPSAVPRQRLLTRWSAEAPQKGVVSRDAFVSVLTSLQTSIILGLVVADRQVTLHDLGEAYAYRRIDVPPDEAGAASLIDVDVRVLMSRDGLDVTITPRRGPVQHHVTTWAEVFAERKPETARSMAVPGGGGGDNGGKSMALGVLPVLPPSCERYLRGFRACIQELPVDMRATALAAVNQVDQRWHGVDHPEARGQLPLGARRRHEGPRGELPAHGVVT